MILVCAGGFLDFEIGPVDFSAIDHDAEIEGDCDTTRKGFGKATEPSLDL